jgi:clan AA aspartic protease
MNGYVDGKGRALITVHVRSLIDSEEHPVEAWIDTGFNGDLVIPLQQIGDLDLEQSGSVKAVLADGSEVALQTYTCFVDWFGNSRRLEVIANDGECALLGVGLLLGRDLLISYRSGEITID